MKQPQAITVKAAKDSFCDTGGAPTIVVFF